MHLIMAAASTSKNRSASKISASKAGGRKGASSADAKPSAKGVSPELLLQADKLPPLILIVGPDRIRRERALAAILSKHKLAVTSRVTGGKVPVDELAARLNSPSLFEPKPVIVLAEVESLKGEFERNLAKVYDGGQPFGLLFGLATSLPATSPLRKAAQGLGGYVELEQLSGALLKRWVARELKGVGVNAVSEPVLDHLIQAGAEQPGLINQCVEKLALYLNDNEEPTIELLQYLFQTTSEAQEFALLNSLLNDPAGSREAIISRLFAEGKNPFQLLALVARSYSQYLSVKSSLERGEMPADIRGKLGVTQWVFERQLEGAKRFSRHKLKSAMNAILKADSQLKNRSLGPEAIFSVLGTSLSGRSVVAK